MNLRHVLIIVLIFSLFACSGGGNNGTIADLQPDNVALGITKDNIFYPGELGISTSGSEYISQNGLATVVAEIKSIEGSYYNEPALVNFTSDKVKEGLATIDSLVETVNGITQVTYSPLNFTGVDTIYASTTIDGIEHTATAKVTVASPSMLSILFVCSEPGYIGIKGTGAMGIPEVSKVTFQVTDEFGKGVPDTEVSFRLNTLVPGLSVSPETASTDQNGNVVTYVKSGDFPTSVRVTAIISSTSVSTQSDYLIVSTGLPDQNSFFITNKPVRPTISNEYNLPIRSINCPGDCPTGECDKPGECNINVIASDHFNNPVPDGTAIYFTTTCGQIGDRCYTLDGECSVAYKCELPDGTICTNAGILAITIGEETFKDLNSNGIYDKGDVQIDDIGEPWLDEINFGQFDEGVELFWDQNGNGDRDQPGKGFYNGILCREELDEDGSRICYKDLLYVMSQAIVNPQ